MLDAVNAARERKTSIVTQLVANGAAKARDIAVAASNEFGVPLFDLDAINLDLDAVRLVSDKLLARHRVLPLFRRGKRLFLAVADPTNLHAIDEVKFQTSLGIEAIVVEDDKLQKAIDKALEQVDNQMSALSDESDMDLDSLEVSGGEDELDDKIAATMSKMRPSCVSSTKSCWMPSDAAHRIFTSSRSRRSIAYACGWTAYSKRSRSLRCNWHRNSRRV